MSDFLQALNISKAERDKLRTLDAATPFGLLCIRKASRDAFDQFVGLDRADYVARELENLLNDDERLKLSEPTHPPGKTGAKIPGKPDSK